MHLEIQSELIPRLATGFCSGMARTGGMCGAVSGGVMAIGLALGRVEPGESADACYSAVQKFIQGFLRQFETLSCPELTGVNLATPEGQAEFQAKGQMENCIRYVGEATQMVVDVVSSGG